MERDHVSIAVEDAGWIGTEDDPTQPRVVIEVSAEAVETIRDRIEPDGTPLDAAEVDVALRLLESLDEDAGGVLGVSNRLTGEYILELNVGAASVIEFVRAARAYGEVAADDEGQYEIVIVLDGTPLVSYEKRTFLVYDDEGSLLRQQSLIPSGVEL